MIGHLIYTYDKIDDARILQEISRENITKSLGKIYLVHAYNGLPSFSYRMYLEDKLIKKSNRGHFKGAADLINTGIAEMKKNKDIDFAIVTASDIWPLKASFLKRVIDTMRNEDKYIATCAWNNRGLAGYDPDYNMNPFNMGFAVDFFILNVSMERKLNIFPIPYDNIIKKFADIKLFFSGTAVYLEEALAYQYAKKFSQLYRDDHLYKVNMISHIYCIKEREPIFEKTRDGRWVRRMEWGNIGLYTYHDDNVQGKKSALQRYKIKRGRNIQKLLLANQPDYYNQYARRKPSKSL